MHFHKQFHKVIPQLLIGCLLVSGHTSQTTKERDSLQRDKIKQSVYGVENASHHK